MFSALRTFGLAGAPSPTALVAATAALALPTLVNFYAPPFASLIPQVLGLLGWGWWLAWSGSRTAAATGPEPGLHALVALMLLMLLAALASAGWYGLPVAILLRDTGVMLAALPVLWSGARLMRRAENGTLAHHALILAVLLALLLAGMANALIAIVQYFAPVGTVEPLSAGGRAGGHIRQPNLLATQLLWAVVALVALRENSARFPRWLFLTALLMMALALGMSASRMGALACALPAVWGVLDRRLSRLSRGALVLLPGLVLLAWLLLALGSPMLDKTYGGISQLTKADLTSARANLWRQCLVLIAQNPWFGVGWGQFNLAWTLTPMEPLVRSSGHTFTHSHNLFLQWAVELGLPAMLLATGLLAFSFRRAWQRACAATGWEATLRRAALLMVAIVLWHGQFEFPFWHVHYLFPSLFLWGLALGGRPAAAAAKPATPQSRWRLSPALAGALVALAGAFALWDYQPISHVYFPTEDGLDDDARIARARRSLLYGPLADRFAGTLAPRGQRRLEPYDRVVFEMLDVRLLLAWTQANAERGQIERARYLAERLREFPGDPLVQHFFEVCKTPAASASFQCQPPAPGLTFRDFRHPPAR